MYQLRKHYDKLSRENVNDVRLITKPYPKIEGAVQIEMTPDLKALLEACVAAVCRVANADALTVLLHQRAHYTPPSPLLTQAQIYSGQAKEADAQMIAYSP